MVYHSTDTGKTALHNTVGGRKHIDGNAEKAKSADADKSICENSSGLQKKHTLKDLSVRYYKVKKLSESVGVICQIKISEECFKSGSVVIVTLRSIFCLMVSMCISASF